MSPRNHTKSLLHAIWLVVALVVAVPAHPASLESAVKAAFLYKFASYVEWPPESFPSPGSPFHLCVGGSEPFRAAVREIVRGQSVGNHPIVLHELHDAGGARVPCHTIFAAPSPRQRPAEVLNALRGRPILTVTDSSLGSQAGIIHFVVVDQRVSFDIDVRAAEANRLVISSKLLALAHKVVGTGLTEP